MCIHTLSLSFRRKKNSNRPSEKTHRFCRVKHKLRAFALGNFDTLITPQRLGIWTRLQSIAKFGNHNFCQLRWSIQSRAHSSAQSSKENVPYFYFFYYYCCCCWHCYCCCCCCYWYHIIHIFSAQKNVKRRRKRKSEKKHCDIFLEHSNVNKRRMPSLFTDKLNKRR